MRARLGIRLLAFAAVLALAAAACGGGEEKPSAQEGKKGGSIVLAAEQWVDCMNPLNTCAAALWHHMFMWQMLPRLAQWDENTNAVKSDLITELPTLDNGGLKKEAGGAMTITYHLNPDAVWEDGTPITSRDVEFTWKAITNSKTVYATAGYDQITDVDSSDPRTAVLKFKTIYTDWPDLLGGNEFGVLKAAAYPKADKDKPDISSENATGPLPFSGGPWIQRTFTKTESVFVRNPKYWGKKALLDRMTWVPRLDQNTEVQGILSGEIDVVGYPQPGNVSLIRQLAGNPNVKAITTTGNFYEFLFINNEHPVLRDKKVREALFYAVDRQEVIDGLIKLNKPDAKILNCGYISLPGSGPWCSKTYFDEFSYQPQKSLSILKAAGWNCDRVPASPCTKGSQTLNLQYRFCNGNLRRQTTYELLKEKAPAAGFAFTKTARGDDCAAPLFTQTMPRGDFAIADAAQGPLTDPTPTGNTACDQIPTAENGYSGSNFERWCNEEATRLMKQSDTELDNDKRLALLQKVYELQVADRFSLPIYVLPNVFIYRTDKLGGPLGKWTNSIYGGMFNSNEWFLK